MMLRTKRNISDYLPAILMTGALQFFVFEFLVAGSWRGEYSYTDNFISDLGVPYCGSHGNAPCSASSVLITMSFVVMGVSFLAAAIWMRAGMRAETAPLVGSLFMGIAAAGAVVVGLVHSNVNWPLHSLGSSLFLIFGSCSLLTVGLSHNVAPRDVASFLTAPLGLLGLVAFFCYVNSWQLGLGPGGIERVSAYSVIVGFACGVSVVGRSRFARDRAVTTRTTA